MHRIIRTTRFSTLSIFPSQQLFLRDFDEKINVFTFYAYERVVRGSTAHRSVGRVRLLRASPLTNMLINFFFHFRFFLFRIFRIFFFKTNFLYLFEPNVKWSMGFLTLSCAFYFRASEQRQYNNSNQMEYACGSYESCLNV